MTATIATATDSVTSANTAAFQKTVSSQVSTSPNKQQVTWKKTTKLAKKNYKNDQNTEFGNWFDGGQVDESW